MGAGALWHCGIPGSEKADTLARQGTAMTLSALSRLLEYIGVQQEELLRAGPRLNTTLTGKMFQVTDIVNLLSVGHV